MFTAPIRRAESPLSHRRPNDTVVVQRGRGRDTDGFREAQRRPSPVRSPYRGGPTYDINAPPVETGAAGSMFSNAAAQQAASRLTPLGPVEYECGIYYAPRRAPDGDVRAKVQRVEREIDALMQHAADQNAVIAQQQASLHQSQQPPPVEYAPTIQRKPSPVPPLQLPVPQHGGANAWPNPPLVQPPAPGYASMNQSYASHAPTSVSTALPSVYQQPPPQPHVVPEPMFGTTASNDPPLELQRLREEVEALEAQERLFELKGIRGGYDNEHTSPFRSRRKGAQTPSRAATPSRSHVSFAESPTTSPKQQYVHALEDEASTLRFETAVMGLSNEEAEGRAVIMKEYTQAVIKLDDDWSELMEAHRKWMAEYERKRRLDMDAMWSDHYARLRRGERIRQDNIDDINYEIGEIRAKTPSRAPSEVGVTRTVTTVSVEPGPDPYQSKTPIIPRLAVEPASPSDMQGPRSPAPVPYGSRNHGNISVGPSQLSRGPVPSNASRVSFSQRVVPVGGDQSRLPADFEPTSAMKGARPTSPNVAPSAANASVFVPDQEHMAAEDKMRRRQERSRTLNDMLSRPL